MSYSVAERQRICSYCGGEPFPTMEAFNAHWKQCPNRIRFGYIPKPKAQCLEEAHALRREAAKLIAQAEELERMAEQERS